MSEEKKIPENCFQCSYSVNCYSYYGGSLCKYKHEIDKRYTEPTAKREKGG